MRRSLFHPWLLWAGLACALVAQLFVGQSMRSLRPAIEEMPFPPSAMTLKAMAFGDDQALFRLMTRWLQDVGDGGGRMRPLRDYDYDRVVAWLEAADSLDPQSSMIYQLGARYFGAISDPESAAVRVGKIADYFRRATAVDAGRRWPWLAWAAVATQHVVKDPALARRVADDLLALRGHPDVPEALLLLAAPLYRLAGDLPRAQALDDDSELQTIRQTLRAKLQARMQGADDIDTARKTGR